MRESRILCEGDISGALEGKKRNLFPRVTVLEKKDSKTNSLSHFILPLKCQHRQPPEAVRNILEQL